jgi:hypothetical protein
MTVITEPGIYPDIPNDKYHADPVPGGSLSVSGAKVLLEAPSKYAWQRTHATYSDRFDLGSVAHALVLDDDTVEIVEVDAKDWRTKAATEAREAARARGAIALLSKDMRTCEDMADAITKNAEAAELLALPGKSEQSAFWIDHRTDIWRRARFDRLPDGEPFIVADYKTAASAKPGAFAKAAGDFGYHQQAAWYAECAVALGLTDAPSFVFIVQEKEAPYITQVFQLDDYAIDLGHRLNARALDIYAECIATDTWPDYGSGVQTLTLPTYITRAHEERIAS